MKDVIPENINSGLYNTILKGISEKKQNEIYNKAMDLHKEFCKIMKKIENS